MKKLMFAVLALFSAPALADNSITISAAAGEFKNQSHTERYTLEVRKALVGDLYGIAYAVAVDHPRPEMTDRLLLGIGYRWHDWIAEAMADNERIRASLMYDAPTEAWEIRGGVVHGEQWGVGFSHTALRVSVGYPVGPATVGAYYEVGNVTRSAVSDWYGGYLSWRW